MADCSGCCPNLQEHEFSHEQLSEDAVDNPFLQQLLNELLHPEQQSHSDAAAPVAQWQAETGVAGTANIATVNQMMALAAFCCTRLANITWLRFYDFFNNSKEDYCEYRILAILTSTIIPDLVDRDYRH